MNSKQIAAIIVVVVIIVAACAVYMVRDGDEPNTPGDEPNTPLVSEAYLELLSSDVSPCLEVYGNVNEDLVIDEDDITALQSAISAGTTANYRLADANQDGTVDSADVEYIQKIIDATVENPVTVTHLNRYTKGDYWTETKYPIGTTAISGSANIITVMAYAGVNDQIRALSYNGLIDATLYADYQYLYVDGTSSFDVTNDYVYKTGSSAGYFSAELLTNHIVKDGISAIITADNAGSYLSGSSSSHPYGITEEEAENMGLDVVRIASASTEPNVYLSDIALICFLMGTDPANVQNLTSWYQKVIDDLNSTLESHVGVDTEQIHFAVSSATSYSVASDGTVDTYNYVSSGTSDYTAVVTAAGGFFAMGDYDFGTSSSSSKYYDLGEWLIDYDIDKIIVIKTGSDFSWYGGTTLTDGLNTVQSCALAFSHTEAYYNGEVYVLSGDMPILLRTVYAACILYPELFSVSWADAYNVEHCTQFLGLSESTVNSGQYFVTMNEMGLPV